MIIDHPIEHPTTLVVRAIVEEEWAVFGDLAERGYDIAGLGWLLNHHEAYQAVGTTWVTVSEESTPLGVACAHLEGTTGGVYYVGTPPEHRGRGVAAAATAWVTNQLFAQGASTVSLQASKQGFGIYQRLGFKVYDTYDRYTFAQP
jgi:ribosomal protein S18 acetylase RimI-like enzyme